MSNIVLTADRATLSHYRHNLYLGFLSCLPDRLCPEFIYKTIVPAVEPGPGGTVKLPHLSLRAVEAACFHAGFKSEDITILPPDALESKITPDTKIVGISVHDPLGYGPATTTWSTIFKGVPFNRIYFLRLMDRVRALKRKHGFKVVVGGPGDWQLASPATLDEIGIDFLVLGEAEIAGPKLFGAILAGRPPDDRLVKDRPPAAQEIPPVLGPSAHHLVEITRGCGRGCDYCAPDTSGNFRSLPLDKILSDVRTHIGHGIRDVTFHSDDSLRYGSSSLLADKDALLGLFAKAFEAGAEKVTITHASLVNIATQPDIVRALTKLLNAHGMDFFGCQPGLETGSARLIGRHMKGKAYPRDPKDWQEVIIQALTVMKAHHWYAVCTLICGLPEEDAEDVAATTALIRRLGNFEALFIPLFFAPTGLTRLHDRERFVADAMLKEHWELMLACWDHNFKHLYNLYHRFSPDHGPAFTSLIRVLIVLMKGWVGIQRNHVLRKAEETKRRRPVSPGGTS
jgi:radical SAM superfamily enzyme YgiQ (UPF0313 family)